jgi:hypothetical protein
MTRSHIPYSSSVLGLVLLLGLAACKPPAPAASDAAAPPAMDGAQASNAERVAAAVDAINPMTSSREVVIASMHKLMDARSYHISMQMSGGPKGLMNNEVDFVAPDRFRMQMAGVGTQFIIGDTMYMSMQGRIGERHCASYPQGAAQFPAAARVPLPVRRQPPILPCWRGRPAFRHPPPRM